jgi:hypothetical protein
MNEAAKTSKGVINQFITMRAKNANESRFASPGTPGTESFIKPVKHPLSKIVLVFVAFLAIAWLSTHSSRAQNSSESNTLLLEQAHFGATDFAALHQGEPVIRVLPVNDKREVAVYGLVRVQASADVFLETFRESMTRKSNGAILEIGRFSKTPTLDDLKTLTMESRDIEDLKQCVVGDCQLKLSANMIERFHKEVNWQAPDYAAQATQLFKVMLQQYVQDYLQRGDQALIEYGDKPTEVRVAEEQRALFEASRSFNDILPQFPEDLKNPAAKDLSLVEDALVWSKIKFGLKPVLAINHILIYKRQQQSGPQILIASKQIYANHYFDSSLALTAFINKPGSTPESYLVYENRSRADGLGGIFGKVKRGIVEDKAVAGLKSILEQTRLSLAGRAMRAGENSVAENNRTWREWKAGGVHLFWWLFGVTAIVVLGVSTYQWKYNVRVGTPS